jgi:arylsulfatase A-like enzyme/Flp pilus assembly protein TadD
MPSAIRGADVALIALAALRLHSLRFVSGLLAAALCACRGGTGLQSKGSSVVLISIDTLRADRLGAYGSKAGLTPNLDAFAPQAVLFEEAYSHVPLTLPAHASLLTSLLPPHHGVRDNLGYALAGKRTVADAFKAQGYRTLGAVSSFVLRRGTGISQGFDEYDDAIPTRSDAALGHQQRDGTLTAKALSDRIAGAKGRFFAFLHLYEPHTPYEPPPRHAGHQNPYDGDVAYADEIVGLFLDSLRSMGRYDDAIIAITADHGEGLGDHGEEEHGIMLYRESLHVPLMIRLPNGRSGGKRVAATVRQADIAQTLLDLASVPTLENADGESLVPLMQGAGPDRIAYAESFYGRLHMGWSELYAATEGRNRYIRAPRPEFYELSSDPFEKNNLIAQRASLAGRMDAWVVERSASQSFAQPGAVDAQTLEKLRSLGYLGGSVTGAPKKGETLPDPKDHIASWSRFENGLAARQAGRIDEAIRVFEDVLKENPRMSDGWETLAQTLFQAGRMGEARTAFDRVIAFDPARSSTHISIAKLERMAGRAEAARQHAEIATKQDPGGAYEFLAELELGLGRFNEAEAAARKSVAADPSRTMSHYALGVAAVRRGDFVKAEEHFRAAIERSASDTGETFANLHSSLADCLARMGREAEAEAEFRKEIEIVPASRPGRIGLTMLLRSQGRDADARSAIGGLIEGNPMAGPDEFETVIRTLGGLGDSEGAASWIARARARYPKDPRFR